MQFPQNPGFGMMQGQPQFVQPGAGMMQQPNRMMMGQPTRMGPGPPARMGPGPPNMMPHGQMMRGPQGMYPVSMMGPGPARMMPPTSAPPSYSQARMDSYQMRPQNMQSARKPVPGGKSQEDLQKEKYFQQQQAKLKHFNKFGSSGLDPNKLIDSMFTDSQAPKPRTNKKQEPQAPTDDGFGDFLSSSQGHELPMNNQQTIEVTQQQIPEPTPVLKVVPAKPVVEKKDLTKMMMESCDLNTSSKAKLFQKPSLKDIVVHQDAHVVAANVSMNARKWDNAEELSNLFIQEAEKDVKNMPAPKPVQTKKVKSPTSKHPPKPPPWLSDDNLIPPLYKQVVEASIIDDKIATDRVYPILILSGLPKEKLGYIWGLCNTETPGQLVVKELYQILAIIALTQNGFHAESVDILSRCPNPPVPFLAAPGGPAQVQPVPSSPPVIGENQPIPHNNLQTNAGIQQSMPQTGFQPNSSQTAGTQQLSNPQTGFQANSSLAAGIQQSNLQTGFPANSAPNNWPQAVPQSPTSITSQMNIVSPAPQASAMTGPGMMTSPATLPVTQLPPAVVSQGMMGNVVQSETIEDDFADFQVASAPVIQPPPPGSFKVLMADVKESNRAPVKDQGEYLYSVPIPDDKAIAQTMSPEDFKSSTVSNFFASDDSSEATSPDDDYFDGYKSAESKPSDSTSQFSTDQSESEDFKNFENYLDEFQKKKEQRDKESPLHRPVPKFSQVPKVQVPNKSPQPQQLLSVMATDAKAKVSSDEFSDFADFQSASAMNDANNPLKVAASASDLIGDEDKYAALRGLTDFSMETEADLMGDSEETIKQSENADEDDNWADFESASSQTIATEGESEQVNDGSIVKTETKDKSHILNLFNASSNDNVETKHLGLSEACLGDDESSGWAAFSEQNTSFGVSAGVKSDISDNINPSNDADEEDWADFAKNDNFDDFQSAIPDSSNKDLVTVKNKALQSSDIMNLFKVKDTPSEGIKALDDDVFTNTKPVMSLSQNINKLHGIPSEPATIQQQKNKHISEEDDFMRPPPLDSVNDDDFDGDHFGTYTGGYDLDDMMQPKLPEKKPVYGWFGVNQGYAASGSKTESKTELNSAEDNDSAKNVTIEITKESDMDDSDSVSSKDNDIFRGKFGLGKGLGEDTQSVSSLEFITNKHMQGVKDVDSQSMSSNDFGNFENGGNGSGNGMPAESKSVDSLELRQDDRQEGETSGSQDNSDKDSKEESPDRILPDDRQEGETSGSQDNSDKDSKEESPDRILPDNGQEGETSGSQDNSDKDSKEESPDRILPDNNTMLNDGPTTLGMPILGDRYSAILPDVTGSDKYAYEWQRLLDNACRMIQDANNIFNSISTSSVCNEVIKSTDGSQYVQGVIEIYRVVCKVITSMKETGISNDKLSQLTKNIDITWNNLTAFLVGGSIMPEVASLDYKHGILHPDDTTAKYSACGICLLNVEMVQKGVNPDEYSSLAYGGKQYHASCANFWINCVDSTLPALNLPELL